MAVRIAPHAPHNYSNVGAVPAKMVMLLEPSMIAFSREVGSSERQPQPDLARLGAAMERHGIDDVDAAH
nr:hypothetical protein [Nitrosomonas nitrosa]